jgi:hypothetical protein
MELLDLKVGGIAIGTLLLIWGVIYIVWEGCKDWRQRREFKKEVDDANLALHARYRWEPDMRTGSDQGKWMRKDGLHDDEYD